MEYKRTPEQRQKIDELIWALLSGKYKRLTGSLRGHTYNEYGEAREMKFCCLGVACDVNLEVAGIKWDQCSSVVAVDGGKLTSTRSGTKEVALGGYAPAEVANLYGFSDYNQSELANANDGGVGYDGVDPWAPTGVVITTLQRLRDELTSERNFANLMGVSNA